MARRRDLDDRPGLDAGVPLAERTGRRRHFWEEPGGLDLASSRLLPGGQAIELRFRYGQLVEVPLSALGFAGPGLLAAIDPRQRGVVLALRGGGMVDLSITRLLAAADPEFQAAQLRAAQAPAPVGALIRARRRAAGLTAAQVAEAAGMAPSNYARLEASRHQPRLDTLHRVAAALGVELEALLIRRG